MSTGTSQVSISVSVQGPNGSKLYTFPSATNAIPPSNTSSPSAEFTYGLTLNTPIQLNVPPGAQYFIGVSASAGTCLIKGVNGDTGAQWNPVNPIVFPLVSGATTLILECTTSNLTLDGIWV